MGRIGLHITAAVFDVQVNLRIAIPISPIPFNPGSVLSRIRLNIVRIDEVRIREGICRIK